MSILIPIRNRLFNRLPYSVLMEFSHTGTNRGRCFSTLRGLTPVALCLIPKRQFGQGRKIQIFGHATKKSRSKYPDLWPFIFIFPMAMLSSFIVDWRKLKAKGWNVPTMFEELDKTIRMGGDHGREDLTPIYEAKKKPQSDIGLYTAVAENKEEIHREMMQQAMKRYHKDVTAMARQDSELKALLDTNDINVINKLEEQTQDKEIFALKKIWVEDYKEALKDVEKDGDFTVVKQSLEERLDISGRWGKLKSSLFAESPGDSGLGDFDTIEANETDSEPEESQNMGFRNRKIAEYEDRIRQYSTPDKIFSEID